jgi:hypothetical protein
VRAVTVDSVREVDTVYWFDGSTAAPTVRAIVEHARLMLGQLDANLAYQQADATINGVESAEFRR